MSLVEGSPVQVPLKKMIGEPCKLIFSHHRPPFSSIPPLLRRGGGEEHSPPHSAMFGCRWRLTEKPVRRALSPTSSMLILSRFGLFLLDLSSSIHLEHIWSIKLKLARVNCKNRIKRVCDLVLLIQGLARARSYS